jgi:hypothetical protein
VGGYSGGGTAGYPYATKKSLRAAQPEDVDREFVIGVLDTGVSLDWPGKQPHPYIKPNLALGWETQPDARESYSSDEDSGYDDDGYGVKAGRLDGHGTFVAGVIVREAPFASLEMRNPLDGPTSPPRNNELSLANAIRELRDVPNLKLVNLGGYNIVPVQAPAEIEKALDELFGAHEDLLVVTSLSNNWSDEAVWPAAFNAYDRFRGKVVAVGAVDETPTPYVGRWRTPPRAAFANWGGVDVWASGVGVLGPHLHPENVRLPGGEQATGWATWSGTPFATAAVTGMVARMMKYSGLTGPEAYEALAEPRRKARINVAVQGVAEDLWRPWLRVRGSRWPEFPGV